jgi:hypothetical protein
MRGLARRSTKLVSSAGRINGAMTRKTHITKKRSGIPPWPLAASVRGAYSTLIRLKKQQEDTNQAGVNSRGYAVVVRVIVLPGPPLDFFNFDSARFKSCGIFWDINAIS